MLDKSDHLRGMREHFQIRPYTIDVFLAGSFILVFNC